MNPKAQKFIDWLKTNAKLILLGIVIILALSIGFIVIITAVLLTPIIKWWLEKRIVKKAQKSGDYIDVEYEIVETKQEKEKQ